MLDCEGSICEGIWTAIETNTGIEFDDCASRVITLGDVLSCGSFVLESDGSGLNQCGPFSITLNFEQYNLSLTNVIVGDCCMDEAPLSFDVSYEGCSTSEILSIQIDGVDVPGSPFTVDASIATDTTFMLTIPADGMLGEITAEFVDVEGCLQVLPYEAPLPCTPILDLDILGSPELSCKDSLILETNIDFFADTFGILTTTGTGMLSQTEGSDGDIVTYIPGPGDEGEVLIGFTIPSDVEDCPDIADTVAFWIIPDTTPPTFVNCPTAPFIISTSQCAADGAPVSYTHLTLPTKA